MLNPELQVRLERYLSLFREQVKVKGFLGDGTDGAVWKTDRNTAVKIFKSDLGYYNERDSYHRLAEYGMTERIGMFRVPRMMDWDDDLMVVEMDLMIEAPYIIDFAKVRFSPPDFPEMTQADAEERGIEDFEDDWPVVKMLLRDLESVQIYYLDPRPWNIVLRVPQP
jgi:hypothetical protein